MTTTSTWTPGDQLADVVKTALDQRGITYESHGSARTEYLVIPIPGGPGEICLSDVDSALAGTLGEFRGMHAHYLPTSHMYGYGDDVQLFESPDLGALRGMDAFAAEFGALLAAITACLALVGSGDNARRTLAAQAAERFHHHTPPPATYRYRRAASGIVTLAVTTTAVMDARSLAVRLAGAYSVPLDNGTKLPATLTVADVMQTLADESAGCADGWHFWAQEPSEDADEATQEWATGHIGRLFPDLTPYQD
ncbi:hypothetical protein ACIOJE_35135 [Kitasatospora sp. NPDC087861]|uniref:hypothetical protein n=1 Tax=Kitasatospora sp. NPDC087861 TaxID=3364070 RepID=UPI0037FB5808